MVYRDWSKTELDGLKTQDPHHNLSTEKFLLEKKASRGGPTARLSSNLQTVKFSKPLPDVSGHLEELVNQSSGDVLFGQEEGDEEVLEKEDMDIREYWETGTQEGCLQEDGEEVCGLSGGRHPSEETRVCWGCNRSGHIKSSCPLRRWNHLGVATAEELRKESAGTQAGNYKGGDLKSKFKKNF